MIVSQSSDQTLLIDKSLNMESEVHTAVLNRFGILCNV